MHVIFSGDTSAVFETFQLHFRFITMHAYDPILCTVAILSFGQWKGALLERWPKKYAQAPRKSDLDSPST